MSNQFRAFYRHIGPASFLRPFNRALPRATDQQLHGGRTDAAQVKAYFKTRDQGVLLAPHLQVARVEVRLGSEGLRGHKLVALTDMAGFGFRKRLMPYFRHVIGSIRPVRPASKSVSMLTLLDGKNHEYDLEEFQRSGVGAFLAGGKRAGQKVRLLRDTSVNNRIGQALGRLEGPGSRNKSVCEAVPSVLGNPVPARHPSDFE